MMLDFTQKTENSIKVTIGQETEVLKKDIEARFLKT